MGKWEKGPTYICSISERPRAIVEIGEVGNIHGIRPSKPHGIHCKAAGRCVSSGVWQFGAEWTKEIQRSFCGVLRSLSR
jgi:hypothetical protein